MNIKNIIIKSKIDELPLSVTMMIPDGEIKAIFQISHGMAEHKERYYPFMEYMTNHGYLTVIHDHRGHGKSILKDSDKGYFYDDKGEAIVDDLNQITTWIKNEYPNKKIILFGHSMGSMVVRKYLKKYDQNIDKLIVCGSPSYNKYSKLAILLIKTITPIKGAYYRSKLINNLAFGSYNKKIDNVTSPNDWICSDKQIVSNYDNDENCGFIFTLNGFLNLFTLMKDIYNKKNWNLNNKRLPIFFIAGEDDPVIISKKDFKKAYHFLEKLGYQNVKAKLYPEMRHEILNEINKEIVFKDIKEWCDEI